MARSERYFRLEQPALVINFQPHMHFRGSRMLLEAIHVDGRRELLTDVPNYEQVWQLTYTYKEPHLFPAGTILHSVAWHDNTAANKHNPDPTSCTVTRVRASNTESDPVSSSSYVPGASNTARVRDTSGFSNVTDPEPLTFRHMEVTSPPFGKPSSRTLPNSFSSSPGPAKSLRGTGTRGCYNDPASCPPATPFARRFSAPESPVRSRLSPCGQGATREHA